MIYDLLAQIENGVDKKMHHAALFAALTIPDLAQHPQIGRAAADAFTRRRLPLGILRSRTLDDLVR